MSQPLHRILSDEGFRIFFPLTALHAGIWPLIWVLLWSFDLPLSRDLPPGVWHGYEMIFGAWGAALIGCLTTAAPEWTDTPRLQGRVLWVLAAAWAFARICGLTGADLMIWPAALADLIWLGFLSVYLLVLSWRKRTDRALAFAGWVLVLTMLAVWARLQMALGEAAAALRIIRLAGLLFAGLLALALARITVPVTNEVLDPTGRTSPFRPHPGRLNLAPGLVALALLADIAGASMAVTGWLWLGAGAAFMERMAEGFIGRAGMRCEILGLMAATGFSGLGMLALGAARLGAPWSEVAALHLVVMGGLGLGVLAVLAIAGRFHTGQGLGFSRRTRAAFALIALATCLRVLPEMGLIPWPPGPLHAASALAWAAAFLLWVWDYWPAIRDGNTLEQLH